MSTARHQRVPIRDVRPQEQTLECLASECLPVHPPDADKANHPRKSRVRTATAAYGSSSLQPCFLAGSRVENQCPTQRNV